MIEIESRLELLVDDFLIDRTAGISRPLHRPTPREVVLEHPGEWRAYREGKTGLLGFFVGQVMRRTRGQANPKLVNELLQEKLGEP